MTRLKRIFLVPVLAGLCLVAVSQTAQASSFVRWSEDQLADFSAAIVTGRVSHISTGWDKGAIYTYVTIDVDEVLKGPVGSRQVVLKQLGGLMGEIGLEVSGQSRFAVGEAVLVFAEVRPRDATLYTSALWQGKWDVETLPSGERMVVQRDPSIRHGKQVLQTRSFEAMRRDIADRAGDVMRAAFFVTTPDETPSAPTVKPFAFLDTPAKWLEVPVAVDFMAGGQPGLAGGGFSQFDTVMAQWNAAGAAFSFATRSTTVGSRCANRFENSNIVHFVANDPCGEISNTGGLVVVAETWFSESIQQTFNGTGFRRILEVIVTSNGSATAQQFLLNANCFQQFMLHEFGHALGLGHTSVSSAVMFATTSFSECSAGALPLHADDIAGIQAIYGATGGGGAPAKPTITSAAASDGVLNLAWTATGGAAPTSHRLNFFADGALAATATSGAENSVGIQLPPGTTGTFSVTVTPMAGSTPGPASDPFTFSIGVTSPPGKPTITQAQAAGGVLTVAWTPGSGASATGHRLNFFQGATSVASATTGAGTSVAIQVPPGTIGSFAVTVTPLNGATPGPASDPFAFSLGPSCSTASITSVTGSVVGSTASISWVGAGAATYVVQAGTAQGGSNLFAPTNLGGNTGASASGLPPGFMAWVRITPFNPCGQAGAVRDFLLQ